MKVLVAGIGNVLRGDDGFGVAAARRLLEDASLPPQVTVLEAGIAGDPFPLPCGRKRGGRPEWPGQGIQGGKPLVRAAPARVRRVPHAPVRLLAAEGRAIVRQERAPAGCR
jgi:hypothetical protein